VFPVRFELSLFYNAVECPTTNILQDRQCARDGKKNKGNIKDSGVNLFVLAALKER
jgi:hypothetical protein